MMESQQIQMILIDISISNYNIYILFSIAKQMSNKALTGQNSQTGITSSERQLFFISEGIRKRKIFYNVKYTEQEEKWINIVRQELKSKKGINIEEKQTILRYYYSSSLNIEKCLERMERYHKWFNNPNIQILSRQAQDLISQGFVYSYGKAKDGRAFIIMNLGLIDQEKYTINHCYQAINFAINRVIKEQFVLGYIQTYYYILDANQQLLSLPLGTIGEIATAFADAYSMRLQKMYFINMTTLGKWLYNRISGFISQETVNKISLFTKKEVNEGCLRQLIDIDVIEKKYGGFRHNINYQKLLKKQKEHNTDLISQSQYFSIEQAQQQNYYTQKVCCGGSDQCIIY